MNRSEPERRSLPMAFPRVFSLPPAVIGIGYLASYVLLDWVSFIQPFAPFGITPWNPPTGLSFIVVLLSDNGTCRCCSPRRCLLIF